MICQTMLSKPTKSLKIPKGQPEAVYRRRTDNKEKDKSTDKHLQNITHKNKDRTKNKNGLNPDAPEG